MILLFYYAANKFLKNGLPVAGQQSKYIRIIETRYLAPKKSLHLIEVGGEYLLLSNSGENLQYIKQVDMLEEIEVLGSESMTKKMSGNIQAKIIDLVSRLPKRDIPFDDLKTTGSQRP
jgi:flagellar protein FliO/FliZ